MAHLNGYKCKIDTFCGQIDPFKLDVTLCVDPLPKNVGYFDIVNYCIEKGGSYTWQSFKAYKSLEAFKYFESGFVQQPSCQNINDGSLILACVKHPIETTQKPLRCWISLDKTGIVLSGHCTCMTDLSDICSHIVAALFALEAWSRKCQDTDNSVCVEDSRTSHSYTVDSNSSKSMPNLETFEYHSWMAQICTRDRNSSKSKLGTFKCNECSSTFDRKWNFDRHSLTHTEDGKLKLGTFKCDKCYLTFNRKWNLDRHVSSHKQRDRVNILYPNSTQIHTDSDEEPQYLPLILNRNQRKNDHDDEGKDFLCNICAQLFRQKACLMKHMKVIQPQHITKLIQIHTENLHGDLFNPNPKNEFTNEERNAILQFLLPRTKDGKLKKGAIKEAATEFYCNRATISRVWQRAQQSYADGNQCANVDSLKKKNCGRKRKDYSENISKIQEVPPNNRNSLRSLSKAIGVPKTTLFQILKRSKAKIGAKDVKFEKNDL